MHYLDFVFFSLSKSNLSISSACTCCEAAIYLQYSMANSPLPCENRSPKKGFKVNVNCSLRPGIASSRFTKQH